MNPLLRKKTFLERICQDRGIKKYNTGGVISVSFNEIKTLADVHFCCNSELMLEPRMMSG